MWEGTLQEDQEVYLMVKSHENKVLEIKEVLDKEHPYKVYEFLYHNVHIGNNKYEEWVNDVLKLIQLIHLTI